MSYYNKFPILFANKVFPVAPSFLLSAYNADSSTVDEVNSHNGTLVNGATYTTAGVIYSGFTLDGVNDYIDIGNDVWSLSAFSFSVWIKLDLTKTNVLLANDNYNGLYYGWYLYADTAGKLNFASQHATFNTYTTTNAMSANSWTHIALTLSGTTLKIYINNVLSNTFTIVPPTYITTCVTRIGATGEPPISFFTKGQLDAFQIWNNYILTTNDVATLYNNGLGVQY